ncbi:phage tail terminator family protein [Metaclostridioides mangenotii]|uniref:phage tail terminator family protein n=1 Tax=Metaclostridioides mangenotii TaxID=1540 RepID=UPI00047FBAF2|nr:hypothetical protein [Clostridioides mangenotii]
MLSYKDILDTFTKEIRKHFIEKIYTSENNVQDEKGSCFFVQILPEKPTIATLRTDRKAVLIEIRYLQQADGKKENLYLVLDKLEKIFTRGIRVKDRYLKYFDIEPNILKDDIGSYVSFLIMIRYHERIAFEEEEYEPMQYININFKEGE